MSGENLSLDFLERTGFALRSFYNAYGYRQYKMSKFELYDLYAENKDFLISDSVITFMDRNGKLMALKPDVTLSIVKNTKVSENAVVKLYYHENIYRVAKGSKQFRELPQIGLECLGDVDSYCICEVLSLAAQSLQLISKDSLLSISDLGIVSDFLETMKQSQFGKSQILKAVGEKNVHELRRVCAELSVSDENTDLLTQLIACSGQPETVLNKLETLLQDVLPKNALSPLKEIISSLKEQPFYPMLRLDLSVVDDVHYYNGIVFKGFVNGVSSSVLSGGQYDKLMVKMQKNGKAIGFAVYMDALQQLGKQEKAYDADVVLVYGGQCEFAALEGFANQLRADGKTVAVQKSLPQDLRYKKLLIWKNGEVKEVENHG